MHSLERNVEKQLIIRTFEPDMALLKRTAKQVANMKHVTLNLYGQMGEVLIVVTVRAIAQAAATEITQQVLQYFEQVLADQIYDVGKEGLGHFAAQVLAEHECLLAASDAKTGAFLSEHLADSKIARSIFDFGQSSYEDTAVMNKIKQEAAKWRNPGNLPQTAAGRAWAAAKAARADMAVSITGSKDSNIYVAVFYQGYVYMRMLQNTPEVGKKAALVAFDMIRRILNNQELGKIRVFKANAKLDWEKPLEKAKDRSALVPIVVLAALLVALGLACWYFFTTFSFPDQAPTVPAQGTQSVAQSQSLSNESTASSSVQNDSVQAESQQQASAPAQDTPPPAQPQPQPDANGEVRPFA